MKTEAVEAQRMPDPNDRGRYCQAVYEGRLCKVSVNVLHEETGKCHCEHIRLVQGKPANQALETSS